MSIVVITIPGTSKQTVVNELQKRSNGQVSLVIIQRPRSVSWSKRWRTIKARSFKELCSDLWFGALLRLRPSIRKNLDLFRYRHPSQTPDWSAPTLFVDNVNHPDVIARIKQLTPSVLAVWGSTILVDELISSSPHPVNLHMGISPRYRGAVANHRAVHRHDWNNIGFTVHYMNGKADAGNILHQQRAAILPEPAETFATLNAAAEKTFIEIICALHNHKPLTTTPQDISIGENVRLRDWTPKMRYEVGQIIEQWKQTKQPPQKES